MLQTKASQLEKAGLGLFSKQQFEYGDVIVEYWGDTIDWAECQERNQNQEGFGDYYLYLEDDFCVDAQHHPTSLARYANDAEGLSRVEGLQNNAQFELIDGKPFMVATADIKPGDEIFVEYGQDYWDVVRERIAEQEEELELA